MKPMPASAKQRPTCSGVRSILTPREASTSAAPEREDNARLPCLATGIPAPATMKAAHVDTLTEPEPSPPVPTTSTASAGALTRSILLRIADTAPVISSTVSPRTRSAINSPPICEGVASPDIMLSKAEAASSRDSVAPVATFPMIDLRSSIASAFRIGCRLEARPAVRSCSVVSARHLREGGLVDGGADLGFDLVHVLRDLFVGEAALQRVLQFLHLIGGDIDRRFGHVGDAEYDPLAAAGARRLSDAVLGGAERGRDRGGGDARKRGVAAEAGRGLDHLGGLCAQPA